METHRKIHRRLIFFAAAVILLALAATAAVLDPHLISLLTLRKVDDFPLYTMRYIGDYHLLENAGLAAVPAMSPPVNSDPSFACTAFFGQSPQGEALMGRNFDWEHRATLLLFTDPPDGYASVSMVDIAYLGFEQGVTWEALQNLRSSPFWPFDGMNERGVAVGILAVPPTPGLHDPAKPTLDSLSVIRLILDYAGDLDEALALIQSVNIDFSGGPWVHYFISDPNGSAVVEILRDRISIIRNQEPWQAATNFLLTGLSEPEADASCPRYRLVSDQLAARGGSIEPAQAMELLKGASQESTVWSVVYNLDRGEIRVALGRNYGRIHSFQLKKSPKEIR